MPFDDLDLEFEEDEKDKKKSSDLAPESNLDLDFQISDNKVTPIGEAKKILPQTIAKTSSNLAVKSLPQENSQEVIRLRNELREAEMRALTAEIKLQILSDLNGDMKLLDHQVNQYLTKIARANPNLKNDLIMIKKLITDFIQKKRT